MKQQTTTDPLPSRVCFDSLEVHIRQVAQQWLQRLLEEEVTEQMGRLNRNDGPRWMGRRAIATAMADPQ